jgi:hypothetical protein
LRPTSTPAIEPAKGKTHFDTRRRGQRLRWLLQSLHGRRKRRLCRSAQIGIDEAGWPLAPTINTSPNDVAGYVSMFVTGDNLEPRVEFICQALNSVGVECRREAIAENSIGGNRELNTVYIVVGRKS